MYLKEHGPNNNHLKAFVLAGIGKTNPNSNHYRYFWKKHHPNSNHDGKRCKNTVLIDQHERYVQHGPNSNRAVTIKQRRVSPRPPQFFGTKKLHQLLLKVSSQPSAVRCDMVTFPCFSVVPEVTQEESRGHLKGTKIAQKAFQGFKSKTRHLLG